MIRCAITDRTTLPGNAAEQKSALIALTRKWSQEGIDYIQLREKTLPAAELASLAREILQAIANTPTQLLINARADIALATAAHGVHLTASPEELTPTQIRTLYTERPTPTISISCHTLEEVARAAEFQVDLILFGPIFGKQVFSKQIPSQQIQARQVSAPLGLEALRTAATASGQIPILALGGINEANTAACLTAGADGIAAIRLFA